MPPSLTQAHIRLLGLSPFAAVPPPDAESSLSQVIVEPHARRTLIQRLYLSGRAQWGVVFGQRIGETLHVHHFALHAPTWAEPSGTPYTWDTRYLMGYVDALVAEHDRRLDWHGVWRVAPDSHSPAAPDLQDWVMTAAGQGLCDDRSPLITAGWADGGLAVHAYRLLDGEPTEIPVHILR